MADPSQREAIRVEFKKEVTREAPDKYRAFLISCVDEAVDYVAQTPGLSHVEFITRVSDRLDQKISDIAGIIHEPTRS